MDDIATRSVAKFYDNVGWNLTNGVTEDARRWEDLRDSARQYVSRCRLRLLRYIPNHGDCILDMASGPIQYDEYLEYSRNFRKRYCVDLSGAALDLAKRKIGDHGVFLHGNFLEMDVETDYFDCCISLHTIYHIHADLQESAVRKLLDCAKPGAPVIVVYTNPDSFQLTRTSLWRALRTLAFRLRLLQRKLRPRKDLSCPEENEPDPYYHAHPLRWWIRFEDQASVEFHPWRSFSSDVQKKYLPNNRIGTWLLAALFWLEDHAAKFFLRHGLYQVIVMQKRV